MELDEVISELADDSEFPPDVDEELESLLIEATGLLEEAKRMLGFYGSTKLTPQIMLIDRAMMRKLATQIQAFQRGLE